MLSSNKVGLLNISFIYFIVIYNTHAEEEYVSGKKITEVSALISDKFNREELNNNPPKKYTKTYEASRDAGILYYNQDLSNNAVLIELGNNKSSDSDVEECVNTLFSIKIFN